MLIVALVMAVIGLAALVAAVVTSNEAIAWVCIGASVIGVVLLIVDAVRERQRRDTKPTADDKTTGHDEYDAEYPEERAGDEAPATEDTAPEDTAPEDTAPEGHTPEERSDSETSR
jgi:membrane protein implicated in regulation of membrane protease activity